MKKLFLTFLILFVTPALQTFAEEVPVSLPSFNVTVNGTKIQNENLRYPLIVHNDITYFPMTYHDCRYLGLITDWSSETNTLSIEKSNITCAYRNDEVSQANKKKYTASVCSFNIFVNGKEIKNSIEKYPLLIFRDITYFPLTWRFAYEEFGWSYSFDSENGLYIDSDNIKVTPLIIPGCNETPFYDGEYYYFNGKHDGKNVIYRTPVSDTSTPHIIHQLAESLLTRSASFEEFDDSVYISYLVGGSASMSARHYYKVESDGTLTRKYPGNYSESNHGRLTATKEQDGIFVKFQHEFFESARITYTVNEVEYEAEALPGRIQLGQSRNGIICSAYNGCSVENCVNIHNGKIYFTAYDADTGENSHLYCLDTADGKIVKLLDNVWGYYLYSRQTEEEKAPSTVIIYDSEGKLMQYDEKNGAKSIIDEYKGENMALVRAYGNNTLYTVFRSLSKDHTIVNSYFYSDNKLQITKLLDTFTKASVVSFSDTMGIIFNEENADDTVRLMVINTNNDKIFRSFDKVEGLYAKGNTVIYKVNGTIVKAELE